MENTRFPATTPLTKVCVRGLIRDRGSKRKPQDTRKAMSVPTCNSPFRIQYAAAAIMATMPHSAMKETPGQVIALALATLNWASRTLALVRSKRRSSWGSTV